MPSDLLPAESDPSVARLSSRRPIALTIFLSALFHAFLIFLLLSAYPREPTQTAETTGLHLDIALGASGGYGYAADRALPASDAQTEALNVAETGSETYTEPHSVPADSHPLTDVAPDVVEPARDGLVSGGPVPDSAVHGEYVTLTQLENIVDIDFLAVDVAAPWQTAPSASAAASDTSMNAEQETIYPAQEINTDQLNVLEPRILQWVSQAKWLENDTSSMTVEHEGQQFTIDILMVPAGDAMALNHMHLEISTILDGRRLRSSVQVREKAFSHYAKFVNYWDPDVSLSDDWVDGRFHSNSPINLANRGARPVFNGPVTVAAPQSLSRRLRESIFMAGVQTSVRQVPLPHNIVLPDDESVQQGQWGGQGIMVRYFDEDTHIVFQRGGDYVWKSAAADEGETEQIGDQPAYLIARNNARLSVEGEVNGRVLVYSPRRITISGDLTYARDPILFPDSDDFLGLISDGSVEIAESHITGPGDLTIQAAIFARSRFSVRRFRDRAQGVLRIFGSVSAGSVSATEPRYSTRVEHDNRLEARRPPSFPTTGHFEMVAWDRQWYAQDPHR